MNKERIEEIKERLDAHKTYGCAVCTQRDCKKGECPMLNKTVSDLLAAYEEAERKIKVQAMNLKTLRGWRDGAKTQLKDLTAQLQAEQEKVKGLERQNRLLHKRIDARG